MNRDIFIRNLTADRIKMSPKGRCANELTVEEFEKGYESFFDMIFEIAATDISSVTGYGEFDDDNKAPYVSFEEFIRETFNENQEGYWHNWTKMFETTFLKKNYVKASMHGLIGFYFSSLNNPKDGIFKDNIRKRANNSKIIIKYL